MKKELEEKFIKRFPSMFREMYGDPKDTCLCDGFEVYDGWFQVLWELCEALEKTESEHFKFTQIKTKFAMPRVYTENTSREGFELVARAEHLMAEVCELCGALLGHSVNCDCQ